MESNIKNLIPYRQDIIEINHNHSQENMPGPMRVYEWHNSKNKVNAYGCLHTSFIAMQNRFPSQAKLYQEDAVEFFNKDRSEKCVAAGKKLGIDAKLFAVDRPQNHTDTFEIKSSKFNWKILPVEMNNERIPEIFLDRRNLFLRNNIRFDSFAIAVPHTTNRMPLAYALKTEMQNAVHKTTGLGIQILSKGKTFLKPTVKAIRKSFTEFMKDPVLLGCYGTNPMFMIEIGRWE